MTEQETRTLLRLHAHLMNFAGAARSMGHRAEDAENGCALCIALAHYERDMRTGGLNDRP